MKNQESNAQTNQESNVHEATNAQTASADQSQPPNDLEWTDLSIHGWGLYQRQHGLRFSIDAVLLSHFVALKDELRVIDACTGTGVIAFLMAARQKSAHILGIDIQPQLIANAHASRKRNGIEATHVDFSQCDMRTQAKAYRRQFDLMTCNPPFYKLGHGATSPDQEVAMARHEVSLSLAEVFQFATVVLKERGKLAMIHSTSRLDEVIALALAHKCKPTRLQLVYARTNEPAKLFLLECCYLGAQTLVVEEPLYIYDDAGCYRPTIQSWYQGENPHGE